MSPSPSPSPGWVQPFPPPQRDSTRTIAIIALVVGSLALIGQVLTMVVPVLLFGMLGFGGSFLDEEFPPSEGFSFGGGQVSPAADGTVSAAALTQAVRDLVDVGDPFLPPVEQITCDAPPRVAADVSVLCRSTPDTWFFIVRFVDGSGEFEVHAVESNDMMWMP
jgi:hypothetical protein